MHRGTKNSNLALQLGLGFTQEAQGKGCPKSLEKRRLWGSLKAAFQELKGASRKAGEGFCVRECSDRTRGNSFKLKEDRFRSNTRNFSVEW